MGDSFSNNPWLDVGKQNISDIQPNAVRGFHVQAGTLSNLGIGFNFRGLKAIVSNNQADRADYSDIQTAINYVNANGGGVVYIKKGTYTIGNLTLYSNVDLIGESAIQTILDFNSTPHFMNLNGVSNCTISSFTLKNSTYASGAINITGGSFITIENCEFTNNTIDIYAQSNVLVLNVNHNTSITSGTFAYLNNNSTRCWFENNYISGCTSHAFIADTTNAGGGYFNFNFFSTIIGSAFQGKFAYARISGNIAFYNTQSSTAYQLDFTSGSANVLINGNHFSTGGNGGCRITSSGIMVLSGNNISGATGNGLQLTSCDDIQVVGNRLNADAGICLLVSSTAHVECTGNRINSTGANNHGISLVTGTESTYTGNWIQSGSSGTAYGVSLDANSNNNAVVGNRVRGNTAQFNNLGTGNVVASNA